MTPPATPESSAQDRILEACRWEIAERGVRGLRVQNVAKRAGVSLGLVYYHFTDRAGLLRALLDAVNSAALTKTETQAEAKPEASSAPQTASDRSFERVLRVLVAEIDDDPETRANSVVWNEIRAIAVFERELQDLLATTTRQWNDSIGDLIADDGAPADEVDDWSVLYTALVEGLSGRWLSGQVDTATARRLLTRGAEALRRASREGGANPPHGKDHR